MIPLRGGNFVMGDQVGDGQSYELPVHQVSVAPFALGRFEVSNAEWSACVGAGGCTAPNDPVDAQHSAYPVAGISWEQARAFGDWLSKSTGKTYRLPSEAEWEYAARAGETGKYPWGPQEDVCKRVNLLDTSGRSEHPEWYWALGCDDHYAGSAPVGSFPPNAWGFQEILGNVWEWVADCWHSDYTGAPANSMAWRADSCRKHVNRGGGWGNNLRALRLSSRDADGTGDHSTGLGLRIARDLSADELERFLPTAPDAQSPVIQVDSGQPVKSETAAPEAVRYPQLLSLAPERDLEVHLQIQGHQNWQKLPEHSVGDTEQEVLISTRLRSDTVLYAGNLLDPNINIRLAVKQRYLARQGLLRIKSSNGGKLPSTPDEIKHLADQIQASFSACLTDPQCGGDAVYRAAGLQALQSSSPKELEALVAPPATGATARWLYYFGYSGCPGHLHLTNRTHVIGERSIFVNGSWLEPWEVTRSADSNGAPDDLQRLCSRYTVTADVRTGEIYVENVYLPSAPGVTTQRRSKKITREEEGLSVPAEVVTWTNDKLRKTRETLDLNEDLPSNTPFDGNYTVLGHFDGKISVKLQWSFKPKVPIADPVDKTK